MRMREPRWRQQAEREAKAKRVQPDGVAWQAFAFLSNQLRRSPPVEPALWGQGWTRSAIGWRSIQNGRRSRSRGGGGAGVEGGWHMGGRWGAQGLALAVGRCWQTVDAWRASLSPSPLCLPTPAAGLWHSGTAFCCGAGCLAGPFCVTQQHTAISSSSKNSWAVSNQVLAVGALVIALSFAAVARRPALRLLPSIHPDCLARLGNATSTRWRDAAAPVYCASAYYYYSHFRASSTRQPVPSLVALHLTSHCFDEADRRRDGAGNPFPPVECEQRKAPRVAQTPKPREVPGSARVRHSRGWVCLSTAVLFPSCPLKLWSRGLRSTVQSNSEHFSTTHGP